MKLKSAPGIRNSIFSMVPVELGADWDALVHKSSEGTIFSLTAMVEALSVPARPFLCRRGDQTVAGLLTFSLGALDFVWSDFLVYGGIMFSPPDRKQNRAQISSDRLIISQFIVGWLTNKFDSFSFPGTPEFDDWRAFLWHNHGSNNNRIDVELRYTSVIDLVAGGSPEFTDNLSQNPLALQLAKSRRQVIRYGLAEDFSVRLSESSLPLVRLVGETFERQGLDFSSEYAQILEGVCYSLTSAGLANIWILTDSLGRDVAAALIGIDQKRAYYLFGGGSGIDRSETAGSVLMWRIINALAQQGINELDLEGINSPARGYFKTSFGGRIVPYHRVRYPAIPENHDSANPVSGSER